MEKKFDDLSQAYIAHSHIFKLKIFFKPKRNVTTYHLGDSQYSGDGFQIRNIPLKLTTGQDKTRHDYRVLYYLSKLDVWVYLKCPYSYLPLPKVQCDS